MRWCNECEFKIDLGDPTQELKIISDHLASHNPSPAAWAEAYKRIQAGKEKKKKEEAKS